MCAMVGSAFPFIFGNVNRYGYKKRLPLRKGSAKVAEKQKKDDNLLVLSVPIVFRGNARMGLKKAVEESHILKT